MPKYREWDLDQDRKQQRRGDRGRRPRDDFWDDLRDDHWDRSSRKRNKKRPERDRDFG